MQGPSGGSVPFYSTPALAGPSPEVLIPQVAAVTSGIRVGSGGVMLQHYSALKVAESFRVLSSAISVRGSCVKRLE